MFKALEGVLIRIKFVHATLSYLLDGILHVASEYFEVFVVVEIFAMVSKGVEFANCDGIAKSHAPARSARRLAVGRRWSLGVAKTIRREIHRCLPPCNKKVWEYFVWVWC